MGVEDCVSGAARLRFFPRQNFRHMASQAGDALDSKQRCVAALSIAKSLAATWTFFPVLPEE